MSLIGDVSAPYALIMDRQRRIGTIMPDVVVEEVHNDQVVITKHPVEIGAAISDHAFKVPSTVQMKIGFSDSKAQTEGYVQEAYQELLALQVRREPFDVVTGKRSYENMLIESIMVTTGVGSEHALNAVVSLSEVLITYTDDVSGSRIGSSGQQQSSPQQTAPLKIGGVVGLRAVAGQSPEAVALANGVAPL